MKWVRGASLADVLRSKSTPAERLALLPHLVALAEALAYAHREGVIHRDLKPSNVLVGDFGETVVIDWGLAKVSSDADDAADPASIDEALGTAATLTADGRVLGTPQYMAPEQARGERIDARADVYAIGACMYHALSGRVPYEGDAARDVLMQLLAGPPRELRAIAPDVPADLATIVARAMSSRREDRYASAEQMADDLRRFASGQLVTAHAYSLRELLRRWVRKNRAVVTVAAVATLVLAVAGGVGVRRVARERDRANAQRAEAEAQRGIALAQRGAAEKLIAALVGDLRAKLIPLAKTDVLSELGERVLDYYKEVPASAETSDPSILLRRAESMDIIGAVQELRFQSVAAVKTYREAIDVCDSARRLGADVDESSLLKAKFLFRIANAEQVAGHLEASLAATEESAGVWRQVVAQSTNESTRVQARSRLGLTLATQGETLRELGRMVDSYGVLSESIRVLTSLREQGHDEDDVRRNLAWPYQFRFAEIQEGLARSLEDAKASQRLRADLARQNPDNAFMASELLDGDLAVARDEMLGGQYRDAMQLAASGATRAKKLNDGNPSDNFTWSRRADWEEISCETEVALGEAEGPSRCRAAVELRRNELRLAPDTPGSSADLADALVLLGNAELAREQAADALTTFQLALQTRATAGDGDEPARPRAEPRVGLARAYLKLRNVGAALDSAKAAQSLLAERVERRVGDLLIEDYLLQSELVLGDAQLANGDRAGAAESYGRARAACESMFPRAEGIVRIEAHCNEAKAKGSPK